MDKPGSVARGNPLLAVINLGRGLPLFSSGLPGRIGRGTLAPLFGLAPGGGYRATPCYQGVRWALTPPFHPCPHPWEKSHGPLAVCFLWPCPGISPSGCYPAPSPAEPGLSSLGNFSPEQLPPNPPPLPKPLKPINKRPACR